MHKIKTNKYQFYIVQEKSWNTHEVVQTFLGGV